jgi:predicted dehydrogenase
MMRKARIAVIGVGWWGTVGHLQYLAQDERAEVVAVYSRTMDKARERAEEYGVPRYYDDMHRLVDECALDGVIIATTPNVHYDQARYALEHGLHVLMEKPFVLRADHAHDLAQLAEERGLILSICHPVLFTSLLAAGREVVRSGALGQIVLIEAHFSQRVYDLYRGQVNTVFDRRPGMPRPNLDSYADPEIVGGGEGHTQASHLIGTVLWLTGLAPAEVFAYMNPLDCAVDVVNAMAVRFDDGTLATLSANGMLPAGLRANRILIQGSEGMLSLDISENYGFVQTAADPLPRPLPAQEDGAERTARVPRSFVRAILGEEAPYVERDVAIHEVEILDAAYRSAASGCTAQVARA